MAKILIIEDEIALQLLLEYDLKLQNHDVVSVADGNDGYNELIENEYDLALVDWMLPSLSGIDVIKKARSLGITTKLIMLTAKDNEFDIINGLDSGADDYLTKPFSARELNSRINAALRNVKKSKNLIIYNEIYIDLDARNVYLNNKEISLTKKEYELLIFLWENKGIVLSRDSIIEQVFGYDYDNDIHIVDVYIHNLKKKLNLEGKLKNKRGVGYYIESI